ncbi:MAG: agmatine deiminase family protein [Vicinamibacterales bacterium]
MPPPRLFLLAVPIAVWISSMAGPPARGQAAAVPPVSVRPEYERALKSVYLSIPDEHRRVRESGVRPPDHTEFVRQAYSELIGALPGYTAIELAVSDRAAPGLVDALRTAAGPRPFRAHVIDGTLAAVDMWAQDLGERVSVEGRDMFLVPMPVDGRVAYNGELSRARTNVARRVFAGRTIDADFVFEGGNLAFDRMADRARVFIGYNDVRLTIENHRRNGRAVDAAAVTRLIAAAFAGADVQVIGRETQSPLLFHLDQAFILLGDGLAVVNRLVGPPSREQRQLEATRSRLQALGYRTIGIDHTQEDVESYRTSTNAVPFVDAMTGRKTIIFPVFPGEVTRNAPPGRLTREHLSGKALAAYRVYEGAGYQPVPIRDFAHLAGGNTHCITNVLD